MRAPASLLRSPAASNLAPTYPSSSPLPPPSAAAGGHGTQTQSGEQQQQAISVDSDMVVILASLLCALICVAGLALVARCACRRRQSSRSSAPLASAPKGLKKKAIEALPTVSFELQLQLQLAAHGEGGGGGGGGRRGSRGEGTCAICLAEFAEGDELRVLPQCGHGFHVACVDTWLGAHATCPSCRAAVSGSGRCRRCGATCEVDHAAAAGGERLQQSYFFATS